MEISKEFVSIILNEEVSSSRIEGDYVFLIRKIHFFLMKNQVFGKPSKVVLNRSRNNFSAVGKKLKISAS